MIAVSITQLVNYGAEALIPEQARSLINACVGDRKDSAPKAILADWLDEHDEPDLAWALRWMVRHGKYPYYDRTVFVFGGMDTRWRSDDGNVLPRYILGAEDEMRSTTFMTCVLKVSNQLVWLRHQLENTIEPPTEDKR